MFYGKTLNFNIEDELVLVLGTDHIGDNVRKRFVVEWKSPASQVAILRSLDPAYQPTILYNGVQAGFETRYRVSVAVGSISGRPLGTAYDDFTVPRVRAVMPLSELDGTAAGPEVCYGYAKPWEYRSNEAGQRFSIYDAPRSDASISYALINGVPTVIVYVTDGAAPVLHVVNRARD